MNLCHTQSFEVYEVHVEETQTASLARHGSATVNCGQAEGIVAYKILTSQLLHLIICTMQELDYQVLA